MTNAITLTASELLARYGEFEALMNAGLVLMTTTDGGRSWTFVPCAPRVVEAGPYLTAGPTDYAPASGGWG